MNSPTNASDFLLIYLPIRLQQLRLMVSV